MRLFAFRTLVRVFAVLACAVASVSAVSAAPAAQTVTPHISASDQPVVNNTVTATEVVAEVDGWVAVHAFESDGKLIVNQVVGRSPIKAGMNNNVSVQLSETFQPGDALVFMLHIDEPPAGEFNFPGGVDKAVVLNNQVVLTQFKVVGEAPPATMPDTGDLGGRVAMIGLVATLILLNGFALRRRSKAAQAIVRES